MANFKIGDRVIYESYGSEPKIDMTVGHEYEIIDVEWGPMGQELIVIDDVGDRRLLQERWVKPIDEESVKHPGHYNQGGIEVFDIIDAFNLNFNAGNVVKYVLRYQYKGNPLTDLKKAREYIDREIGKLEKEAA